MSNKNKNDTFKQLLPALLNTQEVATLLGIQPLCVTRWEKKIPNFPKRVYLAKRIFRYRLKDVEQYIESLNSIPK